MEERNRSALKEWAAIEQVLGTGHSSLLLRKGGIWERREGFQVEHREFWLFPTHFHQSPQELVPNLGWALESARAAHPDGDRIRIEHYARVEDAFRVESLEVLKRVEGLHALSPATVEARFRYRDRPYLHVLLLRVYRMPRAYQIPNTLDYEGCVSWVQLDEALSTGGARPVLDDQAFAAVRRDVLERLATDEGVVRV